MRATVQTNANTNTNIYKSKSHCIDKYKYKQKHKYKQVQVWQWHWRVITRTTVTLQNMRFRPKCEISASKWHWHWRVMTRLWVCRIWGNNTLPLHFLPALYTSLYTSYQPSIALCTGEYKWVQNCIVLSEYYPCTLYSDWHTSFWLTDVTTMIQLPHTATNDHFHHLIGKFFRTTNHLMCSYTKIKTENAAKKLKL